MLKRAMARLERTPTLRIGAVLVVASLLLGVMLFQKNRITTILHPGESVQADFSRDYRLRAYVTKVKVAGVPVGVVSHVEHASDGTTRVTMKLDNGSREKLRSTPSAAIRPTTLLGGNYYVDLNPGGDPARFEGVIPKSRTTTPVELDRVLEVLKPTARVSMQKTVERLDSTLGGDGRNAIKEFLGTAPQTFESTTPVLKALRGTRPSTDLATLVTDLSGAARVLTSKRGELASVVEGLSSTSRILSEQSHPIADAIAILPQTLRTTRAGLNSLSGSLDRVEATAGDARPIARELDHLLERLAPALVEVRPVIRDLRPTLADLRPLVADLVPTSSLATQILDDVDGGPLDRLNGPITKTVLSPWKGSGDYVGGGNSTVLYKELGNFIAGMVNAGRMTDKNGGTIHFQPGFGVGSISGTPISFEQLVKQLLYPGVTR